MDRERSQYYVEFILFIFSSQYLGGVEISQKCMMTIIPSSFNLVIGSVKSLTTHNIVPISNGTIKRIYNLGFRVIEVTFFLQLEKKRTKWKLKLWTMKRRDSCRVAPVNFDSNDSEWNEWPFFFFAERNETWIWYLHGIGKAKPIGSKPKTQKPSKPKTGWVGEQPAIPGNT